jgi:hypothetical protein
LLPWSALGVSENYEEGQLTRFMSVEYKSDLRRDGNDYLSKNAEQEVIMKLGLDYQKDDTQVGEKWVSDDCSCLYKGLLFMQFETPI